LSSESAARLRIEAGPSLQLATYLVTVHAAALLVGLVLPVGLALRLLLAGVVAVSLVRSLRMHVWRSSARAVVGLDVPQDQPWTLRLRNGSQVTAHLLGSSLVHPRLLVLNFCTGRLARRSLVLAADAADPAVLRQLRVRLRLTAADRA
jgi:toxin CptA